MRHICRYLLITWIIGSMAGGEALARGGRGGGGGGGGGGRVGGGGGGGFSPSMSRPSAPVSRPSAPRPSTGAGVSKPSPKVGTGAGTTRPTPGGGVAGKPSVGAGATRPTPGQLNNFLDLGGAGAGRTGAASTRPAGGNAAVSDFLSGKGSAAGAGLRPSAGTRDLPAGGRTGLAGDRGVAQNGRVANRGDFRSSLADNRGERRTQRQQQLGDRADGIRDQMRDHYDNNHLFDNFWANHPHAHYRFDQNPLFWTWATFATVSAFMPWNWGSGAYYDYGSGGNVAYSDDGSSVQAYGETYPADEYAQQAADLAASAPAEPVKDPEWLPLGVFAMTQDSDTAALPNMFLQLAVSKEGIIAGTYQNKTTGKTESIEGMVDKKTQRAAWTVVGKNTPIMETGIANLTMNETKALVHFADGSTQQWLLVRIEKPQEGAK